MIKLSVYLGDPTNITKEVLIIDLWINPDHISLVYKNTAGITQIRANGENVMCKESVESILQMIEVNSIKNANMRYMEEMLSKMGRQE